MPSWWKKPKEDPQAAFLAAAEELQAFYDAQIAEGMSRQAILQYVEMQARLLEHQPSTVATKAKLRALDSFYEELKASMVFNITAGKNHEIAGEIDQAVAHYEMAVTDQVPTRFPYEHLRIIYRRNEAYAEALQVCQNAVNNPFLNETDRDHFQAWVEKLTYQLENKTE